MAGLLMVGMYWEQLSAYAAETAAAGDGVVFNGGPASVLCSFPGETQSLGYLFLIEFFVDSYIVRIQLQKSLTPTPAHKADSIDRVSSSGPRSTRPTRSSPRPVRPLSSASRTVP